MELLCTHVATGLHYSSNSSKLFAFNVRTLFIKRSEMLINVHELYVHSTDDDYKLRCLRLKRRRPEEYMTV